MEAPRYLGRGITEDVTSVPPAKLREMSWIADPDGEQLLDWANEKQTTVLVLRL
jgi:hypothetical protein